MKELVDFLKKQNEKESGQQEEVGNMTNAMKVPKMNVPKMNIPKMK
jgi:hypothetical protein